jgi:hypothetical protein
MWRTSKNNRIQHHQYISSFSTFVLILFSVLALTACQPELPIPTVTIPTTIVPTVDFPNEVIQEGIEYLKAQQIPESGFILLRESPETATANHWLVTDNWLAANVLYILGKTELATELCAEIKKYNPPRQGLIEALAGEDIDWPPQVPITETVASGINSEQRSGGVMKDWDTYADLALYGALDQYNEGNINESRSIYREAIELFDGVGFDDVTFDINSTEPFYTTYKLALAIYVGRLIDEPVDEKILEALLDRKQKSGGFIALYDKDGQPLNDTNTETTSYALLALSSLKPEYGLTFSCTIPANN